MTRRIRTQRDCFWTALFVWLLVGCLAAPLWAGEAVRPLADEYVVVFESPNPNTVYTYTPGLTVCPDERLIATLDLGGPGVPKLGGPKFTHTPGKSQWTGKIFTSDDHGKTWTHRKDFAGMHARPFVAGKSLYVLGHANDLIVLRSDDWGTTWTDPVQLTEGQRWHQSACNVHYANGCVYLVMERYSGKKGMLWCSDLIPVLMRAAVDADLLNRESWTFASELPLYDVVDDGTLEFFGVPFFKSGVLAPRVYNAPIGWLETNVVQVVDPDHYWFDPQGKTFHLLMRAHTGGTGYAALAKVVQKDDGSMVTMLEKTPAGKKQLFVPLPGGQMRFHILYDDQTKLYWLLSTQATDSMTRLERLPEDRFHLPNNERHRLQLHFSKNLVDWCFAGIVALGGSVKQARHYASMAIDGDDLVVLSRSGDARAHGAHDGNIITFHRVKDFRRLVY